MFRSIGAIALLLLAGAASAAGISTTTFSGTGYSNTVSNGGANGVELYSGFAVSRETSQDALSVRGDIYSGIATSESSFRQKTKSSYEFAGSDSSNGLVGRTEQQSIGESFTNGRRVSSTTDSRIGAYAELSAVGDGFNGTVGGELGVYANSSYEDSRSNYGSASNSDTYSVSSYTLD